MTASFDPGVNRYIQRPVDFDQRRETVHNVALYWLLVNLPRPRQAMVNCTEKSA